MFDPATSELKCNLVASEPDLQKYLGSITVDVGNLEPNRKERLRLPLVGLYSGYVMLELELRHFADQRDCDWHVPEGRLRLNQFSTAFLYVQVVRIIGRYVR